MREGLNTLYRRRAAAVDVDYRSRIAALGDLRGEIADAESLDDVDLEEIAAPDCSLEIAWGSRPTEPSQLEGFLAVKVGEAVQYWREGESRRAPAFVERGDRIWVNDRSDNSVRAALLLAQSRYGVIAAWGEAAFIAQACRIGKELGIEVQVGVALEARPPRSRSPRIRRQHDAVRRWSAEAPAQERRHDTTRRNNAPPVKRKDDVRTPDDRMITPYRRALLARVARRLSKDDWDPRDYPGVRSRGHDIRRSGDAPEAVKSSDPVRDLASTSMGARSRAWIDGPDRSR